MDKSSITLTSQFLDLFPLTCNITPKIIFLILILPISAFFKIISLRFIHLDYNPPFVFNYHYKHFSTSPRPPYPYFISRPLSLCDSSANLNPWSATSFSPLHSFSPPLIHSFIHSIFIEHLAIQVQWWTNTCGPREPPFLGEKTDNKVINKK